jgi:hypothetical protein
MRPLAVSQAQQSESFFESLSCLSPCCAEEFGDSDESYSGSYAISCLEWHQEAGGGKTFCLSSFLEVTCTSSPQSFGEPAGVGSSGSPKCVRIFRIGPGWRTGSPPQPEVANSAKARDGFALVKSLNAISRMSPPHPGHCSGNSSPTRAISFAHAIRDVACERALHVCHSSRRRQARGVHVRHAWPQRGAGP